MPELRYNPLLGTYTMVAANRQKRPDMPKNWCPFCLGSPKVPKNYDVFLYPNDFPTLSQQPPKVKKLESQIYETVEAYGKCDVVLYSPNHTANLHELSVEHIAKLVALWQERTETLAKDEQIKYIFPFENRGTEVGVTMPHPHGQIYAYPFVPLKITTELDNAKAYFEQNHRSLFDVMNEEELQDGRRMIAENEHFLAYLPHFTDYPFGVFIVARQNLSTFADFATAERNSLAALLKDIVGAFDLIYDRSFPYMMCVHQSPVNSKKYKDCASYYRFHIEFYPPLRAADKIKWYASSEMGAWAAANVVAVEDSAVLMRNALKRFKQC